MVMQLVRKELMSQKPFVYFLALIWFIPMTGFFTQGSPWIHVLLVILIASWVTNYVALNERTTLVNILPVSRKQIITGKYLSAFMWFLLAAVIVYLYVFLFVQFAPFPARLMTGWDLLIALAGFFLLISIFNPLHLLFGHTPASVITVVFALAILIGGQMVINMYHNPRIATLDGLVERVLASPAPYILLFAGVSSVVTVISYVLTVKIYESKDL